MRKCLSSVVFPGGSDLWCQLLEEAHLPHCPRDILSFLSSLISLCFGHWALSTFMTGSLQGLQGQLLTAGHWWYLSGISHQWNWIMLNVSLEAYPVVMINDISTFPMVSSCLWKDVLFLMKSNELLQKNCEEKSSKNTVLCVKVLFKLALNKAASACKDLLFLHERKKDKTYST